VKLFCGKPLIAWTIEAAQGCKAIEGVFVSTDDEEVDSIAKQWGTVVIKRDWVSNDSEVGSIPGVHAVEWIKARYREFDILYNTMTTNPCRLPGQLDKGMEIWRANGSQGIMSWAYCPQEFMVDRRVGEHAGITIITDKNKNFWTAWTGDSICTVDSYLSMVKLTVSDDDPSHDCYVLTKNLAWHTPIALWQTYEVDTPEQWEVAEYFFKKKILDVYGDDPYGVRNGRK
jgi:N-acylneuraminate cytidylyltransferase